MRTVIIGGPKTGKTTFAIRDGRPVYHTDDTMNMEWSEASARVATWFDRPGPWVVEGTAAVRALRKWLKAHPEGQPCDEVLFLTHEFQDTSKGQKSMAKAVATVMREIAAQLLQRGVNIRSPGPDGK